MEASKEAGEGRETEKEKALEKSQHALRWDPGKSCRKKKVHEAKRSRKSNKRAQSEKEPRKKDKKNAKKNVTK